MMNKHCLKHIHLERPYSPLFEARPHGRPRKRRNQAAKIGRETESKTKAKRTRAFQVTIQFCPTFMFRRLKVSLGVWRFRVWSAIRFEIRQGCLKALSRCVGNIKKTLLDYAKNNWMMKLMKKRGYIRTQVVVA